MAASGAATSWRLASQVLMRAWGGEVVAYNDVTGHTHHFMELAAWIFEHLSARTMTEADLMTAAATELDSQTDSGLATSIRNSLALLQGLGLIETAPSA
jgi:PqqD family protein of HPr-rel-A system